MLVNSISAAQGAGFSAARNSAANISFNGKVQVTKYGEMYVFDTDDLPKVKYNSDRCPGDNCYYTKQGDEFVKIGSKEVPMYRAEEPCLHYEHGGDWQDLYITLPNGNKIDLGEDHSGSMYARVHDVLQQARKGETAKGGKPLSLNV